MVLSSARALGSLACAQTGGGFLSARAHAEASARKKRGCKGRQKEAFPALQPSTHICPHEYKERRGIIRGFHMWVTHLLLFT